MRRRAGVGAIQRQKIQQDKFKEKGSEIQENQLEQVRNNEGTIPLYASVVLEKYTT